MESTGFTKLVLSNIPYGIGVFKKDGLNKTIIGYARVENDNSISVITDVDIVTNVTHFDAMTFYKCID